MAHSMKEFQCALGVSSGNRHVGFLGSGCGCSRRRSQGALVGKKARDVSYVVGAGDVQGILMLASTGSVLENVGAGFVWAVAVVSCGFASWFMVNAFLDAREVVDRRKDRPKREEEERQKRIDKLFGRK